MQPQQQSSSLAPVTKPDPRTEKTFLNFAASFVVVFILWFTNN
ncbi:MAG: hypothetical protein ACR2FN_08125 [Chitinophagaceae bacterium]